jgi:hypothetical protein
VGVEARPYPSLRADLAAPAPKPPLTPLSARSSCAHCPRRTDPFAAPPVQPPAALAQPLTCTQFHLHSEVVSSSRGCRGCSVAVIVLSMPTVDYLQTAWLIVRRADALQLRGGLPVSFEALSDWLAPLRGSPPSRPFVEGVIAFASNDGLIVSDGKAITAVTASGQQWAPHCPECRGAEYTDPSGGPVSVAAAFGAEGRSGAFVKPCPVCEGGRLSRIDPIA